MSELFVTIAITLAVVFGVHSCQQSDWHKDGEARKAAQAAADAQPRVIREADGCKVYAFKASDRWHYFTRCQGETTTDSSYTVNCGKNCTRSETESITQRNGGKK